METYAVSPEVQKVMSLLVSSTKVKQALDFLENDHEKRIADQIEITEIRKMDIEGLFHGRTVTINTQRSQ